jgi:hypothetical protein
MLRSIKPCATHRTAKVRDHRVNYFQSANSCFGNSLGDYPWKIRQSVDPGRLTSSWCVLLNSLL